MLMPFGSAYTVHNLGVEIQKLPLVYLVSGLCSIFIGPFVGRAADRFGKFKVFCFGSMFGSVMVLVYTNLGVTPLFMVMFVNALMYLGIFSRMIPSQALMSAIPDAASRGSFMSISSSMQQIAGGFASILAGFIVVANADESLSHFDTLGYILVATSLTSLFMIYHIDQIVKKSAAQV